MATAWWKNGLRLHDAWTLGDPVLGPDGSALEHVRLVTGDTGTEGVAKTIRGGRGYGRSRLCNEIAAMLGLQGNDGVLGVLDSETQSQVWIITELAEPLAVHLGQQPSLRAVVECIAQLAHTLSMLHDQGASHRDLKPANLFWARNRAVLGDFGLVTGMDGESLTVSGEPVGSIYFMAHEAREASADVDWTRCDVYSLAMCMWVIAAEKKFPPDMTLWARDPQNSLYDAGGRSADRLNMLLERATTRRPYDRPAMKEFGEELDAWLKMVPTTERPPKLKIGRHVGIELEASVHSKGIDRTATQCLAELARAVGRELGVEGAPPADEVPPALLGQYDVGNGDPDWGPEWGPSLTAREWDDLPNSRLVLGVVGTGGDTGMYLAEWQRRMPETSTEWLLDWHDRTPSEVVLRFPSDWLFREDVLAPLIARNAPRP